MSLTERRYKRVLEGKQPIGITTHSKSDAVNEVQSFGAIDRSASLDLTRQEAYVVIDNAARDIAHVTSFELVSGFGTNPSGEIPLTNVSNALEGTEQPIGQIASALRWVPIERRKEAIIDLVSGNFQFAWNRMDEAPNPNDPKGEDLKDNCRQLRDRGLDMSWITGTIHQRFGAEALPIKG